MKRFLNLLVGDIGFQKKYGFYAIYLFFTVLYTVLVYALPHGWHNDAVSVVIFSDPALLGLIFIGAIVLYEKSERVTDSLSASPVRIGEYVASKGVSLGIISTLCGCVIALAAGTQVCWPLLASGLFFGSCIFTFAGLGISTRISNFNQFIVWLIPISMCMAVPGLLYKFWLPSPWMLLHPGAAVYNLIDGRIGNQWWATASLTVWLVAAFLYARRETDKMFRSLGGAKI